MGNADVGPFRFFAVASLGALSARFLLLGALSAVFDSAEPSAAAACGVGRHLPWLQIAFGNFGSRNFRGRTVRGNSRHARASNFRGKITAGRKIRLPPCPLGPPTGPVAPHKATYGAVGCGKDPKDLVLA